MCYRYRYNDENNVWETHLLVIYSNDLVCEYWKEVNHKAITVIQVWNNGGLFSVPSLCPLPLPLTLPHITLLSLSAVTLLFTNVWQQPFLWSLSKKILQKRELANLEISSLAGHRPWDSESLESSWTMCADSLTLYSVAVYLEGGVRPSSKTLLNNSVMP